MAILSVVIDRDEQLKKYFITQIPLYIYKDNVLYLADGEESGTALVRKKQMCACKYSEKQKKRAGRPGTAIVDYNR